MNKVQISVDGEHFTRDGESFFWIGDTVWSAFTNATIEEWQEYLDFRAAQGFNVLQINTLPQWDRVCPDLGIYPYPLRQDGSLDYAAAPNPAYVERARGMCRMAVDSGFTLALVVCWANLIPGTWLTRLFPSHAWPMRAVEAHTSRVIEWFDEFAPVYVASGDTDLQAPETRHYYLRCLEILKSDAPKALRTMHLCGESTNLTPELAEGLDFYMYQSGHGVHSVEVLDEMPRQIRMKFPGKPILNAEPCYEGMPKLTGDADRPSTEAYTAKEVVDACRRSILAGAKAGITYCANGLWNWRREEGVAEGLAAKLYQQPAIWRDAMRFPGAKEIVALQKYAFS